MPSRVAALLAALAIGALCLSCLAGGAADLARASTGTNDCAPTLTSDSTIAGSSGSNISGSNVAAPGAPCWVDVEPYPFGVDGEPVDVSSPQCAPGSFGLTWAGDREGCYLTVASMAFRAWNRGIAATTRASGDLNSTTAFGVWIFNGARWFPDPTFPGQGVCKGTTVLWAGKRDYWVVGSRTQSWPSLCRFDGVNFEWQPLPVPSTALAHVPLDQNGRLVPGAINAGSCFSWDNCWFFGSYGLVLHWDGNQLLDATPDVAGSPWLGTEYRAAIARAGTGFAVGTSGGLRKGQQLPPQPDGSPPPQMYTSTGGAFGPLGFSPLSAAQPGDPYRTDLVAVDNDGNGGTWVAGDPVGYRADPLNTPGEFLSPIERRVTSREPAPISFLANDGSPRSCPAAPSSAFSYSHAADGKDSYLWSSISALPATAQPTPLSALAGGQLKPASSGTNANDTGLREPLVEQIACGSVRRDTRFRMPDPFVADQTNAQLIPADRRGSTAAVALNAGNDAWAATTPGRLASPTNPSEIFQRPHLYHLTDTLTPAAPAGDDDEPRALFFAPDPPIIVEAPPEAEPPVPPATTVTQTQPNTRRRVRLKPAIYAIKSKVRRRGRSGGATLYISFKLRRPVTVGLEALRKGKVVSRSGMKHFKGKRGTLVLHLNRRHWPTRIRFVTPKPKKKGGG